MLLSGCGMGVKMQQTVSSNVTQQMIKKYISPKKRVGVVEFVNKSNYGEDRLGKVAADILITELSKSGNFSVIERQRLEAVIEEQKLSNSGIVSERTAVSIGRILGLHAILIGSISNFGVRISGSEYLVVQTKKQEVYCSVDVRLVDVKTGEVIYADSGEGKAYIKSGGIFGLGSKSGYSVAIEGKALRAAISQLSKNISSQIQNQVWSTKIVKVSNAKVYFLAGLDSGLDIGQYLYVYNIFDTIVDDETGIVIGYDETFFGTLKVSGHQNSKLSYGVMLNGKIPKKGFVCRLKKQ